MEEEEHTTQVVEMIADEAYQTQYSIVPDMCMMNCAETPDVAWKLIYLGNTTEAETRWIYICHLCDGESKELAPYWWNKALRGESLDDEEE